MGPGPFRGAGQPNVDVVGTLHCALSNVAGAATHKQKVMVNVCECGSDTPLPPRRSSKLEVVSTEVLLELAASVDVNMTAACQGRPHAHMVRGSAAESLRLR